MMHGSAFNHITQDVFSDSAGPSVRRREEPPSHYRDDAPKGRRRIEVKKVSSTSHTRPREPEYADEYSRPVREEPWDNHREQRSGSRGSSVREVSDHLEELEMEEHGTNRRPLPGGRKFLKKVQHELDEQRDQWKDEVDRLSHSAIPQGSLPKNAHVQGTNSFVDTSSGLAIFTTLVDVREFHPRSIAVDYDDLSNKLIIHGENMNGVGTLTKTFTQKIQLPRYADTQRLSTKLSKRGMLKVEVPLLYYWPEQQNKGRSVKSFVNEVKTNRDGTQTLEILVNTGPGIGAKDLHVTVDDHRVLFVSATVVLANGKSGQKLIKRYTLPERANVDRIRSKMGKDGRLMVLVPLHREK